MNSRESKRNICRICLDRSVVLDWNATVYGYLDVTYKDCFYKYTQLECIAPDPFSQMLCKRCVNGLKYVHSLIFKAIKSHKYFLKTNRPNPIVDDFINTNDDIKYTTTEFEIVLLGKIEDESITRDHFVYENTCEEPVSTKVGNGSNRSKNVSSVTTKQEKGKNNVDKSIKSQKKTLEHKKIASDIESDNNHLVSTKKSERNIKRALTKTMVDQHDIRKKLISDNEISADKKKGGIGVLGDTLLDDITKCSSENIEPKVINKNKELKQPKMCSICSKILRGESAVQMHEKTHMVNRERKEICKVCGLKFYDKGSLCCHMLVHKENRKKNHKCEFCNKAFYYKGDLNVHRRIHLGQMIPCSLCTKQFFKQIDLEKHMNSHSTTPINTITKKRSKYLVRCKYCDKCILSTSFKSHTAAHLNEPLMKCSICSKEFFRRNSCVLHVKKVHQKTSEEYNDFIIQYKKNRMTHLFLEQKADIQYIGE